VEVFSVLVYPTADVTKVAVTDTALHVITSTISFNAGLAVRASLGVRRFPLLVPLRFVRILGIEIGANAWGVGVSMDTAEQMGTLGAADVGDRS